MQKKLEIENIICSIDKTRLMVDAIAQRILEEVGPTPRNAFTLAAHRGLRFCFRSSDDCGTKLNGSDIALGPQTRENDVWRALACWELRNVEHDEDAVLMLRDWKTLCRSS